MVNGKAVLVGGGGGMVNPSNVVYPVPKIVNIAEVRNMLMLQANYRCIHCPRPLCISLHQKG